MSFPRWLLNVVTTLYKYETKFDAKCGLDLMYATEQGRAELKKQLIRFGIDSKMIKEINL